jgi:hypothetical protein
VSKYSLRSVLDWLRAGYPEGIPAKDHFALLAVLRRRLTDDEIAQVVELSIATAHERPDRHVDYDTLRQTIGGVLHEDPTEEDVERVTERLTVGGWPVVSTDGTDPAGDTAPIGNSASNGIPEQDPAPGPARGAP